MAGSFGLGRVSWVIIGGAIKTLLRRVLFLGMWRMWSRALVMGIERGEHPGGGARRGGGGCKVCKSIGEVEWTGDMDGEVSRSSEAAMCSTTNYWYGSMGPWVWSRGLQ